MVRDLRDSGTFFVPNILCPLWYSFTGGISRLWILQTVFSCAGKVTLQNMHIDVTGKPQGGKS